MRFFPENPAGFCSSQIEARCGAERRARGVALERIGNRSKMETENGKEVVSRPIVIN